MITVQYPQHIIRKFENLHKQKPSIVVRAPGRINLIGEHVDYNDGFVLPAAIDKAVFFAATLRDDRECHFYAENFKMSFSCHLDKLEKSRNSWPNYLMGVIDEVQKAGHHIKSGFNVVFGGNIPNGAGVSSSAAIEGGMARLLDALFDLNIPIMEHVKLTQRAENRFVGVNCGIMDMFASIMGCNNSCIKIDCRTLEYEYFYFDAKDHTIILCDTGVKHSLVDSEYNIRRQECETGVNILKAYHPDIIALRDVNITQLEALKDLFTPVVYQRCKFVIEEINRVELACNALIDKQLGTFGELMYQSHEGLQYEYQVSCPELDFLVDLTRAMNYVEGARMMGGGFGGCTINIVQKHAARQFIAFMQHAYKETYLRELPCHEVSLTDGVSVVG